MYILSSKSRWPLSGTSRIAERFYFNLCKTFQLNWGPPQRFRFNMSKNARAECKVKTRFQALLRRCRFSRRSLNERCQPRFELIDDAKFGIKSIHSQLCVILPEMRQKLRLLPLFCVISASISSP